MLNVKTRFVRGGGYRSHNDIATYMGEPLCERLEVELSGPVVCVPLYRPGELLVYHPASLGKMDPVGDETRRQFGERIRRAAREATRGFEEAILKSLREQGHLV